MSNIVRRIEALIKALDPGKPQKETVVLIYGETEPTEDVDVIWVTSEEAKELTLRLLNGELPEGTETGEWPH